MRFDEKRAMFRTVRYPIPDLSPHVQMFLSGAGRPHPQLCFGWYGFVGPFAIHLGYDMY